MLFLSATSVGAVFFYFAKDLPDLSKLANREVIESTKIYDRTGEILLYDIYSDIKRTSISFDDISQKMIDATVSVEDDKFFAHKGISLSGIGRAILINLLSGRLSQGGSTITQQLIKNSFLTPDRTVSRKIKEVILAYEMERQYSKKEIIAAYLNTVSYGSGAYGIESAARTFFSKSAKDITLSEAALLAALPKAPSYYSPYGSHLDDLIGRRDFVLDKMASFGYITQDEKMEARKEIPKFAASRSLIKAPHFVMYVREYLAEKYGEEFLEKAGLKVITTLDYDLQKIGEDVVKRAAKENEKKYQAKNAGLAAIDPKTGQILTMVGSRDYFDIANEGNFNIATASRQPGSAFKPFVYALAFKKGYTPDTVLFDLPAEFNPLCELGKGPVLPTIEEDKCYHPENFNDKFKGPVTLKEAISQSINIPSVKLLYLVGVSEAIKLAESMGISTLKDRSRFGLSLVLGGGEVKLLEIVNAYGAFANDGVKNRVASILKIEDKNGRVLEEYQQWQSQVLDPQVARLLNNILSNNELRAPAFGLDSALYIPEYNVAVKTGTSNDYHDLWTIGYSPNLAAGIWVGNNDNAPVQKKSLSSAVAAPWWSEFMRKALERFPKENFMVPEPIVSEKIMLNGKYINEEIIKIDKVSKKRATDLTPLEDIEERKYQTVHDILYWIDKDNPLGMKPSNPENDHQFKSWESGVMKWLSDPQRQIEGLVLNQELPPVDYDDIHTLENKPIVNIVSPISEMKITSDSSFDVVANVSGKFVIKEVNFFLEDVLLASLNHNPYKITVKAPIGMNGEQQLIVKAYDEFGNFNEAAVPIVIE